MCVRTYIYRERVRCACMLHTILLCDPVVIWLWSLFYDQSAPISLLPNVLPSLYFSSDRLVLSLWCFLHVVILVLTRCWGMTTRPPFHVHIFTFYFLTILYHYYSFELESKIEHLNDQLRCFSPTDQLILTLQMFWSTDWNHPIRNVISDWHGIQPKWLNYHNLFVQHQTEQLRT